MEGVRDRGRGGFRGVRDRVKNVSRRSRISRLSVRASKGGEERDAFASLERVFADAGRAGWDGGRWQRLEGAWVLRPAGDRAARCVVHFIGGAFVGASPQLSYRMLLETLVEKAGAIVIATPYSLAFDQLRCAEEAQFLFDRASRKLDLVDEAGAELPVFGVGHSLGSLLHAMISARYAVQRRGNVLMSYNNKPATDAVPVLSPVLAPFTTQAAEVFEQVRRGPLGGAAGFVNDTIKDNAPPLVKELLPLVEQIQPLISDVSSGRREFTPTPPETQRLVRQYYGVSSNLLIKFRDDSIDETPQLASLLQTKSAIASNLDLNVKSLAGDHIRPLQLQPPVLPQEMQEAATQGSTLLKNLADLADDVGVPQTGPVSLRDIAAGVSSLSGSSGSSSMAQDDIDELVDVIATWIESCGQASVRALPP